MFLAQPSLRRQMQHMSLASSSRQSSDATTLAGSEELFTSDTILIRFLDDTRPVQELFRTLSELGDLRHVDFSFLNYSRSMLASYHDARDCVRVTAILQKVTGISSCMWKTTTGDSRTARVPLVLSGTDAADWEKRLYDIVSQFGDVCELDVEPEKLVVSVTYFDARAAARLITRLSSIEL